MTAIKAESFRPERVDAEGRPDRIITGEAVEGLRADDAGPDLAGVRLSHSP